MSRDFDRFALVATLDGDDPILDLRGVATPGDQTDLARALEAAVTGLRDAGFTADLALTRDPR